MPDAALLRCCQLGLLYFCSSSSNCDVDVELRLPWHTEDDDEDDGDDHHGMSMKMHPSLTMSTAALIVCRAAQTELDVCVFTFMP